MLASKLRIIYQYLTYPQSVGGCGITLILGIGNLSPVLFQLLMPLMKPLLVEDLKLMLLNQIYQLPLSKETYGVEVALYFEYIKHYTFGYYCFLLLVLYLILEKINDSC